VHDFAHAATGPVEARATADRPCASRAVHGRPEGRHPARGAALLSCPVGQVEAVAGFEPALLALQVCPGWSGLDPGASTGVQSCTDGGTAGASRTVLDGLVRR
jgi:hypothetical protein